MFLPTSLPLVSRDQLVAWSALNYPSICFEIMKLFVDEEDIPCEQLRGLIDRSFEKFGDDRVVVVRPLKTDL